MAGGGFGVLGCKSGVRRIQEVGAGRWFDGVSLAQGTADEHARWAGNTRATERHAVATCVSARFSPQNRAEGEMQRSRLGRGLLLSGATSVFWTGGTRSIEAHISTSALTISTKTSLLHPRCLDSTVVFGAVTSAHITPILPPMMSTTGDYHSSCMKLADGEEN